MTFYSRYAQICEKHGIEPCSQRAADMFHVTRATISSWGKKNSAPKGETVATIADALGVSSDYLLGRTDDPTDYSDPDLIAEVAGPVLDHFDGNVKKAVAFRKAVDTDVQNEQMPEILRMYNQLDDVDQAKVEGIIQGLLLNDKYKRGQNLA